MSIGERVRARREHLGMSQSELARRLGLTQGTIAGLEAGKSRSSAHLHRIARELATTAAYLASETDDPEADGPLAPIFDAETRELIDLFSPMPPADRRAVLQVIRTMSVAAASRRTLHSPKPEYEPAPERD